MPRRGSILLSTANEIGNALVDKLGGSGYSPVEWNKKINIMGIASEDIADALDNLIPSEGGGDRGSILISKANEIGAVLNKKFQTERGFKPKEWASAISKLTPLQVKTASGAIASFPDGAEAVPLTSLIANIDPKQDLHGYSKPWAPGAGKNLIDITTLVDGYVNTNGSFNTNHANGEMRSGFIKVKPNTDYYFSIVETTGTATAWVGVGQYTSADTSTFIKRSTYWAFTTDATCEYIVVSARNLATATKIQLEEGAAATDWEPYSNICPIEGSTETTAYQYGKNLLNWADFSDYSKWETDISANPSFPTNASYRGLMINLPVGTYTISFGISASSAPDYLYLCSDDGATSVRIINFVQGQTYHTNTGTFTIESGKKYFIRMGNMSTEAGFNALIEKFSWGQIEVGSTPTTYEAFKQKTPVVAQFGQTVYTGEYNFIDSKLKLSSVLLSLAVDDMNNSENYPGWKNAGVRELGLTTAFYNGKLNIGEGYSINTTGTTNDILFLPMNTYHLTQSEWKTLSAGLTVTVEVMLPEPIEIDLDNPQEVESYLGINNIYNDTGDTSASYYADIDLDNA